MKNTKFRNLCNTFSFTKHAGLFGIVPFVVVLIALVLIVSLGVTGGSFTDAIGIGIDFEGGTLLTVTLGQDAIDNYDANTQKVIKAIEEVEVDGKHVTVSYVQRQEANNVDRTSIVFRYKNVHDNDDKINEMNSKIREVVDNLYPDMPGNVAYESIGATAASDLLSKAGIALAVSVALILIYIIIRFTLMSGFAAIIALLHDVVIMFALTVICRVQINSSYVAAMITIIAYSINNTIIIFDRCREHLKPLKGQRDIDYKGIGDTAVRETMTRSIYTTLTTMITVIFLAILGGDAIREFCVPIILGLVAGFYSSVFLATPLWASMSISFDKTKAKYSKRNEVSYEKKESDVVVYEDGEQVVKPVKVKEAGQQKQKQNTVYKYSKKNTTFKKKK